MKCKRSLTLESGGAAFPGSEAGVRGHLTKAGEKGEFPFQFFFFFFRLQPVASKCCKVLEDDEHVCGSSIFNFSRRSAIANVR